MDEQTSKKQAIVTIAVVAITIFLVLGILAFSKKKSQKNLANVATENNASTATQTESTTSQATQLNNPDALKDGTYTSTGSYTSPGGKESITVTVTIKDGVITETSATSGANDPTAKQYQGEFIAGYKDQVVGKNITTIRLSRVSGSSLTSQGFNSALEQIKQQAQV